MIIAAVEKERATQLPDGKRRFYPTRRFRVEAAQLLQIPILPLRQDFNAHGRGHICGAIGRLVFLSGLQALPVITNASPPAGLSAEQSTKMNFPAF
jgi:hypothetical protein